MSKLVLSTTMTLDGVITVGEWYVAEGEHDAASREQFDEPAAMLMGRKTYEGLAAYWAPLAGEWADKINPLPKYVASRTLQGSLEWNAMLVEGDAVDGISKLKADLDGDLVMVGCGELARHLLENGLFDELRFWIHPALGGEGDRPFEGGVQQRLRLVESRAFDSGVSLQRYEPVLEAESQPSR